jgi:hypothetical protein
MPEAGESLMKEDLGIAVITKFRIECHEGRKKPYVLEPWKGKGAEITEWYRNDSAMAARRYRTELATFIEVKKNAPVYINDSLIQDKTHDLAYFSSDVDGDKFDVANRLVKLVAPNLQKGDRVKLSFMGCCSIANVEKI